MSILLGVLSALIVALPLFRIPFFILEAQQTGLTKQIWGRIFLLLIGLPLLAFTCPWWWFLGGETILLSPDGLRYVAGLPPFRRRNFYSWDLITHIRVTPLAPYGFGYRVGFTYDSELGSARGIGRHLSEEEAGQVVILLTQYQAASQATAGGNTNPGRL